jgi:Kef-type K+ transport system membrane component KefB
MLFLQLAVIVAVCRLFGWIMKRFLGQPQVVGEIIAGVVLGPSLLGALAPDFQAWLFPQQSRDLLFVVAQLGIGLYMFVVGLGFNQEHFRANAKSAAAVSLAGAAAPFIAAIILTPWLLATPGLFSPGIEQPQAMLFLGACVAITAFPVLARIIEERRLSNTPLGALTLSSGAINDVFAWTILAIVLAGLGAGTSLAITAIVGGALFVGFMVFVAPRLLAPLARAAEREGKVSHIVLGMVMGAFLLSAYVTDLIGLHSVFGGFLLGAVMPRGFLAKELRRILEPFSTVILVPVFFCYSGLNTELSLISSSGLALATLAILAASILAKFGGCWAAARLTGQDNPTALAIGALMNARGLMELIIINIGLQRGIIEPALFSIMVLMTMVTTLMATPLFEWTYGRKARERGELGELTEDEALGEAPVRPK